MTDPTSAIELADTRIRAVAFIQGGPKSDTILVFKFSSYWRVASFLQETQIAKKMVDFGKMWNLQKTENASKYKVKSVKKSKLSL